MGRRGFSPIPPVLPFPPFQPLQAACYCVWSTWKTPFNPSKNHRSSRRRFRPNRCRRSKAGSSSSTSPPYGPSSCARAPGRASRRGSAASQGRTRRDGRGPARPRLLRRAAASGAGGGGMRRRTADRDWHAPGARRQHGIRAGAVHRLLRRRRVHEDEEDSRWDRRGGQEPRRAHHAPADGLPGPDRAARAGGSTESPGTSRSRRA